MGAAKALESEALTPLLQEELKRGDSFAAARQRAAGRLAGQETAALLQSPNNILGVEYCRAMLRCGADMKPVTVRRAGAAHDASEAIEGFASASLIRTLLRQGRREEALSLMAEPMAKAFLEEEAAGRAPVFSSALERAMLFRLRAMIREDFAALDEGKEGLSNRLYEASRTAVSVEEILAAAKTKRYAYARLRRMVLWGCLGLRPAEMPAHPLYIRPLAANAAGRALLGRMRKEASLPVLTKSADVRRLGGAAEALFTMEAAAADLYTLAYPNLSAARGDTLWKESLLLV
jgi:predicted nucleotidyltransferase